MSLIDKILNDRVFKSLSKGVPDGERDELEKNIRHMLADAELFYNKILDAASTEKSRESLAEAVRHVIAPLEGKEEKDVEK